jgi:Rhs element Vgr protein
MTLRRRSKTFHDLKDSEVLENILGEYGLKAKVQATSAARPEIVQFDVTDWDFLQIRAESNGLLCMVDDDNIRVEAPDFSQEPVVRPVFGGSILEFDAEIDGRMQPESLSAWAWDPATQELGESEATEPTVPATGNLQPASLAEDLKTGAFALRHPGIMPSDELQAFAEAQMLRQRMAKVRGRVVFQGKAEVKPGVMIELFGVGDRFSGKAFVSGVTHDISGGTWRSHVQFGLSPDRFAETYDIHAPRAAGRYGAVNGLATGLVTQLAGDPDSEDRIRVHLPALNEGDQGVWARVASLDAGKDRGAFFRPEIGDEVIVGFLNDDPNNPVVLGMVHSSALPAPLPANDDNHLKGFVSRSKMELMFDDDKKALTLKTPAGKTIELDEQSGAINIKDENGNKITMEASGITVSASGNLTLKAGGILEIKGTLVKIN